MQPEWYRNGTGIMSISDTSDFRHATCLCTQWRWPQALPSIHSASRHDRVEPPTTLLYPPSLQKRRTFLTTGSPIMDPPRTYPSTTGKGLARVPSRVSPAHNARTGALSRPAPVVSSAQSQRTQQSPTVLPCASCGDVEFLHVAEASARVSLCAECRSPFKSLDFPEYYCDIGGEA